MNYTLHNRDLRILQAEAGRPRHGRQPGWRRVDWKPTPSGGNMIYLRQLALPATCSTARTDVKIEAPPNLYEPAAGGMVHFYYNLFISPGIQLFDRRARRWMPMPRLHGRDADGFAFLCVHPKQAARGKNVLEVLRTLDLFLLNPGYKAADWEVA
jgi:hypothetical protein